VQLTRTAEVGTVLNFNCDRFYELSRNIHPVDSTNELQPFRKLKVACQGSFDVDWILRNIFWKGIPWDIQLKPTPFP